MDRKIYKITLDDGTIIDELILNGNNFISDTIISDDVFENNLETVTIAHENGSTEYHNMKLIQNKIYGTQSWFILTEKTQEEIEKEELLGLLADLVEVVLSGGA